MWEFVENASNSFARILVVLTGDVGNDLEVPDLPPKSKSLLPAAFRGRPNDLNVSIRFRISPRFF